MVAHSGPDPHSLINKQALAKLSISLTALGIRAFILKFTASIGAIYQEALNYAMENEVYAPKDHRTIKLHLAIYNLLVPCFDDHDEILMRMTDEVGQLGPAAIVWLRNEYDPSSNATAISKIMKVLSTPLNPNKLIDSLNSKVTDNQNLPRELRLNDSLLAILLLVKLPQEFRGLRDIVIDKELLPSPKQLISKVKNTLEFQSIDSNGNGHQPVAFAFVGKSSKYCFNCATQGHLTKECEKPKADCDECGKAAGHPTKHCLVISDKPIPESYSTSGRDVLLAKRVEYKKRNANSAMICGNSEDFDEDF